MSRTQNQRMGDAHEVDIANWLEGALQKGSGNQWHRQGDTKNGEHLTPYPVTADGKSTLGESISITRKMWRKIMEQTFNQTPAIFLRWYRDERLREVDLDLAVVPADFLTDVLRDARKWRAQEEQLSKLITFNERVSIAEPLTDVEAAVDQLGALPVPTGGCECCR